MSFHQQLTQRMFREVPHLQSFRHRQRAFQGGTGLSFQMLHSSQESQGLSICQCRTHIHLCQTLQLPKCTFHFFGLELIFFQVPSFLEILYIGCRYGREVNTNSKLCHHTIHSKYNSIRRIPILL